MVLNLQDWLEGQVVSMASWCAHLKIEQNRLYTGTVYLPTLSIFIPFHCRSIFTHHDWPLDPLVMAMKTNLPRGFPHLGPRGSPSHGASAFRRPPPAKAKPNPITGFNAPPDTLPGTITETPNDDWSLVVLVVLVVFVPKFRLRMTQTNTHICGSLPGNLKWLKYFRMQSHIATSLLGRSDTEGHSRNPWRKISNQSIHQLDASLEHS